MNYEFRVWNKADKMPKPDDMVPRKAKGLLDGINDAISTVDRATGNRALKGGTDNPDILIDAKCGEDVISTADIAFTSASIKEGDAEHLRRFVEMEISGNLYLPLDTELEDAAKDMVGIGEGDANKKRDTLLLSKWAAVQPASANSANGAADGSDNYYRGVILYVMTKAGDFRLIAANNVYVEEYSETYHEGEFGTFHIKLKQKIDATSTFYVKGLGFEKPSMLAKVGKAVTAVAGAAATVAVVGAGVVKATTETVEKFTGETDATRKLKGLSDITSNVVNTTKNATSFVKNAKNKNFDKLSEDVDNLSKSSNELIQKSKLVHENEALTLEEMENSYLDVVKKDPKNYQKYKEASDEDKRKMLNDAANGLLDRAELTKEYEQSTIDSNKANLEKEKKDDTPGDAGGTTSGGTTTGTDTGTNPSTTGTDTNTNPSTTGTDTNTNPSTTGTDTNTTPSTPSTDKNTNPSTSNNNNSGGNNSGNGNGTMRGGTGLDNLISNAANNKNGGKK